MTTHHSNACIVWFRQDLRLADNEALTAAVASGLAIIPVYILDTPAEGAWARGAASRVWLHHSLGDLSQSLAHIGSSLVCRAGDSESVLLDLIRDYGVVKVFWNNRYEPAAARHDDHIAQVLKRAGVDVERTHGSLLFGGDPIVTGQGGVYKVYTPYANACLQHDAPRKPLPAPKALTCAGTPIKAGTVSSLDLLPRVGWDRDLMAQWRVGEKAAVFNVRRFLGHAAAHYNEQRDLPAEDGTSTLSPHLHFGEISSRRVWWALTRSAGKDTTGRSHAGIATFRKQVLWREYSYYLMQHFPDSPDTSWRPEFESFPWRKDSAGLAAWQRGETGYPIVDAGMRQLWQTGWMHNRVRMIVASFLAKDLLVHWREGARWFWDTLVDADLANNTMGWQWTAGSGVDAAPYFRVFNPTRQGEKFDPRGDYIRRWLPELATVTPRWIHAPNDAPDGALGGVTLGRDYPRPVVDHAMARTRALREYDFMKKAKV